MKNNSFKIYETIKLHYGKYLYKIKLYNQLAGIFRTEQQRSGKLGYAKSQLQEFNAKMLEGEIIKKGTWTETIIEHDDLTDANHIYACLRFNKDYLVRCEYNTLIIYSNNLNFLKKVASGIKNSEVELWQPTKENEHFLKTKKDVVIIDSPSNYKYKVTFGRKKARPELASWLNQNQDKSKAGTIFIKNCANSSYISGQYIFIRDDKVLFLINMIAGDNIVRVEELVLRTDI